MSQKIKNYKVYKMSLTTLSPIFIGSGEVLNKSMYVYNDKEIMVIDERKLIKKLSSIKGLYESFLSECSSGNLNLTDFLHKNLPNYENIDIYKYKIISYSNIKDKKLNNINTFIKSSNGKPYIPGSSIKGAIRTAIIAGEIMNDKEKYNNFFKDIINNNVKYKEKDIVSNISKDFNIENIFKNIIISDTNDVNINNLYISKRYDIVTNKDIGHELPIYMELLKPHIKFNFLLTLNHKFSINDLSKYFNNFYENNLNDNTLYSSYLSIISNTFKDKAVKNNCNLYSNYNDMLPNIFIGGNNGFLTKSILYYMRKMKNDDDKIIKKKDIINYIKKYLDKEFTKIDKETKIPQHNHEKIDEELSPRSLRFVKKDENSYIGLGMCNIKVEEELC